MTTPLTKLLLGLALLTLVPLSAGSASAQTTKKPTLKSSCMKDLARHCKRVKKGKGRWIKCLKAKRSKLSKRCSSFLRNKDRKKLGKARTLKHKAKRTVAAARNKTAKKPSKTSSTSGTAGTTSRSGSTAESPKPDEPDKSTPAPSSSPYNDAVWKAAVAIPRKGKYVWKPPIKRDGQPTIINIPEPISIAGRVRFAPRPDYGTNCVGFTAAVAMRVINADSKLKSKVTTKNWLGFWNEWMLVAGRHGPAKALPAIGLGKKVSFAEAQRGDFAQLWRTSGTSSCPSSKPVKQGDKCVASGHSVVFKNWVDSAGNALSKYDEAKAVGLKYISSNVSSGISERTECFYVKTGCSRAACGTSSRNCMLLKSELYLGRIAP